MNFHSTRIPYRQTGSFSSLVLDYIDQDASLRNFYTKPPSLQGIRDAIEARSSFNTSREALVKVLTAQYENVSTGKKLRSNLESFRSAKTFTITTAHQNNLFSGPLYVIYKILHAIRLAEHCKTSLPEYDFVPVFYMGSEDADLAELDHIYLGDQKIQWNTRQKGAVGRMKVDRELVALISRVEGQVNVLPFGKEITELLRDSYKEGITVQESTFRFLHQLFGEMGLVVLIADEGRLKKQMIPVFREELFQQSSSEFVESSLKELRDLKYKVQVSPREINLFYLEDGSRQRIERNGDIWKVVNTGKKFSADELNLELEAHPERFSPNVILRGLYQETILPNLAFIGGGGELAYWLELRTTFEHFGVPFPVLVLRNSYLILEKKWKEKIAKLGFQPEDFFQPAEELLTKHIRELRGEELKLNGSITEIEQLYDTFKKQASAVDPTLERHVDSLRSQALEKIMNLEKKMVRAEKRKFMDQQRQIQAVRNALFPGNGLQERRENIIYYYAKWGKGFLEALFAQALALEQEFSILEEIT
jgi:bacillithiol biosynthesis cysteine-adding enzyme BshC